MVLSGISAWVAALLLAGWFVFLCIAAWRTFRSVPAPPRRRANLTTLGLISASIAVLAALSFDVLWLSPNLSQKTGFNGTRIIAMLLFWPSLVSLFLCLGGTGRARFLGIATSLLTGFWWFTLLMGSAISMGGSPLARHPVVYLIPDGYTGWIKIERGEAAPPLPLEQGKFICRIPQNNVLATSTLIEDGWATDEYFYYNGQQTVKQLRETMWGGGGMIWGGMTEFKSVAKGSRPTHMVENIFVGTEDQYQKSTGQSK